MQVRVLTHRATSDPSATLREPGHDLPFVDCRKRSYYLLPDLHTVEPLHMGYSYLRRARRTCDGRVSKRPDGIFDELSSTRAQ